MITTAIIGAVLLLLCAVIAANSIVNYTSWWLCPRCWHWHNDIGERSDAIPTKGKCEVDPCICSDCARKDRL